MTALRIAQEPMKLSQNMFNSMTALGIQADFLRWHDNRLTASKRYARNYAEFYSPLDLCIKESHMLEILEFSTGQVCDVSGMFY